MIEPNCDMPWDIYLDWLQDQGYEDLRNVEIPIAFGGYDTISFAHITHMGFGDDSRIGPIPLGRVNNPYGHGEGQSYNCDRGDGGDINLTRNGVNIIHGDGWPFYNLDSNS